MITIKTEEQYLSAYALVHFLESIKVIDAFAYYAWHLPVAKRWQFHFDRCVDCNQFLGECKCDERNDIYDDEAFF